MNKSSEEVTNKSCEEGSTSVNVDEIYAEILGKKIKIKICRLHRYGASVKASKHLRKIT